MKQLAGNVSGGCAKKRTALLGVFQIAECGRNGLSTQGESALHLTYIGGL